MLVSFVRLIVFVFSAIPGTAETIQDVSCKKDGGCTNPIDEEHCLRPISSC